MSAQNDDEFSLDPTAPRAQPGPDERQSHGGSSPPQPHSSSSSSVTVSRQAPEAMHVGIRPQGMPGFHPAASSASYYPGAVFAGGAASAAPPPGAVPVPRHSYLFEARAPLGFAGVVQQPQVQHFVQQPQQQQFLPQHGGVPRQPGSAGLPIALETETGLPASSSPPPVIGGQTSPLVVSSPGACGSTASAGVPEADGGVYLASSPPPGGIIVGKTVLMATPEKGDPNAKPLYLAQHSRTPTKVRRETDNPPNYTDHHVGPLRNEVCTKHEKKRGWYCCWFRKSRQKITAGVYSFAVASACRSCRNYFKHTRRHHIMRAMLKTAVAPSRATGNMKNRNDRFSWAYVS